MSRSDWRESVTQAADLTVLGFAVTLGCLPVVTAGATIAAASVAVDRLCSQRKLPDPRELLAAARRGLGSGLAVTAVALVVAGVLLLDVHLLRTASIPGAGVATAALALVAAGLLAVAAAATVRIGQDQASGWRAALRWSVRLLLHRPSCALAIVATVAVATTLAMAIPVLSLLLPGLVLFALHVVVRRASARMTEQALS